MQHECQAHKTESSGSLDKWKAGTRVVKSDKSETKSQQELDNPLRYLFSDSDDSDVLRVRVSNKGSEC